MEVRVYVDVLFIINFIIDYILLSITSFFAKKPPKIIRMFFSASIGALFASVAFFMPSDMAFSLFSSFSVSVLMIAIAFGIKKISVLIKDVSIFYLISTAISGIGFSLIFSGKTSAAAINNGIFYADIDAYSLLGIFVISIILIHTATGYIRKLKIKSSFLYHVTIEKYGKTVSDVAFYDSGNFLSDPISHKSVLIAEWQTVSGLFEESKVTEAIVNHTKDFLYIGCNSFGKTTGMYAFTPDNVYSDEIKLKEPILVAITENILDKDGTYRMILPNTVTIN